MGGERYVLLGLARARSEWFRSVASWATAAAIPAEFSKCVSAEELRARLKSGRSFSAALLDGALPATDRDLIAAVREAGCSPIVIDDDHGRDWTAIGAAATLPPTLGLQDLLDVLAAHATMVRSGNTAPTLDAEALQPAAKAAPLVVVCGPGGTGASSVAIALAQGLAEPAYQAVPDGGPVLLADFCRRADLAMLHDARDVVPGLQELVDLHRGRLPSTPEIQAQTFHVAERGYHLLLGLRRPHYWSVLRSRSFEASLSSLRQAFSAVVCDVEPDLEGEEEGGSLDVEERNLVARTAVSRADGVFVVGRPDMPGLHGVVRLIGDLIAFGVHISCVVPVLNQTPRRPRLRAELTRAFCELVGSVVGDADYLPPLFLPARRVNEALRDGVPLPSPLPAILVGAYRGLLGARADRVVSTTEPIPVLPGSVGSLTRQEVPRR